MKVYAFLWNGYIHESSFATMSLHKTREGAEKAMAWHRKEREKEFDALYKSTYPDWKIEDDEAWLIKEMEILD